MTRDELIGAIESVRGVRVKNFAEVGPGVIHVQIRHTFWSWFWPSLRHKRKCLVELEVAIAKPFGVLVVVL